MKELKKSKGTFDQDRTFSVNTGRNKAKVSLMLGYQTEDDGIYWGLAKSPTLKSSYTELDREEQRRLDAEGAIQNGEEVMIDGLRYAARVLGDYSDCVVFDRVN